MKFLTSYIRELEHKFDFYRDKISYVLINIDLMKEKISILLHHDAVTGTSPESTLIDYTLMLDGINTDLSIFEDIIEKAFE